MDILENKIYCVYDKKNVFVKDCMECDKLYECDNMWCDNHKCVNCEHKKDGVCDGM